MIPHVAKGVSVEMIRDGGSYVASFLDSTGNSQGLLLRLIPATETSVSDFQAPVILDRLTDSVRLVGWQDAMYLLERIYAAIPDESRDNKYYEDMKQIIETKLAISKAMD